MKRYGVIGYPLTHSLSPLIHNYAIKQLQLDASYQKMEIRPQSFDDEIIKLKESGIAGFNITIPFKERIIPFVENIDNDALALGAVNTIRVKNGEWQAFNTDVAGFISPLKVLNISFEKCLVLGAGGAARAVIYALGRYFRPEEIRIAARNKAKAQKIADYFAPLIKPVNTSYTSIDDTADQVKNFDLIINATPVGTYPDTDQSPLPGLHQWSKGAVIYDLVYNPIKTRFLEEAAKAGEEMILINGMKMLLAQAAEAFKLWTGMTMPVMEVERYMSEQHFL